MLQQIRWLLVQNETSCRCGRVFFLPTKSEAQATKTKHQQNKKTRDWNLPPNETFYKGDIAPFIRVKQLQLSIYHNAIDRGYVSNYILSGLKYVVFFTATWGKWSNLTNRFLMGWFNHQLDNYINYYRVPPCETVKIQKNTQPFLDRNAASHAPGSPV